MEKDFNYDIEKDKQEIALLFYQYVQIILTEYKDIISSDLKEKLSKIKDFSNYVNIEDSGTISLFATPDDSVIHLPLDAYKVIRLLSTTKEYGSDKSHKTHDNDDMIINDNTYREFIKHLILKGSSPLEYFKEILLHEVMHICGSHGSNALTEGFNELKTRELAQKYGLETSCCGYPKETKIAYELQQLFGKDICDKLAFSDLLTRFKILRSEIGEDAVQLYANVFASMDHAFRPYMDKKYPGIEGISEKCLQYDKIDYSEAQLYIDQYKENMKKL